MHCDAQTSPWGRHPQSKIAYRCASCRRTCWGSKRQAITCFVCSTPGHPVQFEAVTPPATAERQHG